ncbi:hypothetical protein FQN60_011444 [Etheostoma spectabile]|uniref:Uncharacterized protein n=1 Tax=Etheostoma spectabile TaxID=54343 RepID=A0A5J5DSD6_9PERO|nr:hypothetical protein FQN60_011444 [Etheostoma spectabile]
MHFTLLLSLSCKKIYKNSTNEGKKRVLKEGRLAQDQASSVVPFVCMCLCQTGGGQRKEMQLNKSVFLNGVKLIMERNVWWPVLIVWRTATT